LQLFRIPFWQEANSLFSYRKKHHQFSAKTSKNESMTFYTGKCRITVKLETFACHAHLKKYYFSR
jgi:hypothetical protein